MPLGSKWERVEILVGELLDAIGSCSAVAAAGDPRLDGALGSLGQLFRAHASAIQTSPTGNHTHTISFARISSARPRKKATGLMGEVSRGPPRKEVSRVVEGEKEADTPAGIGERVEHAVGRARERCEERECPPRARKTRHLTKAHRGGGQADNGRERERVRQPAVAEWVLVRDAEAEREDVDVGEHRDGGQYDRDLDCRQLTRSGGAEGGSRRTHG